MRGRRRGDQGAAAVEFALVLPLLVLVLFAIIDFGRMLNAQITLTEAAREGARAGAILGAAQGEARALAVAGDLGPTVDPDVTSCPNSPSTTADVTATVTYEFEFVTPLAVLAGFGDGTITMTGKGLMPCL
jgi:Flp pilus assembly protein TadG